MPVSSPSPESTVVVEPKQSSYHHNGHHHLHLCQVCKHSSCHRAQFEAHPREANSKNDILSFWQAVNNRVLVGGEGVDAGLLNGHLWVDPRTVGPEKTLQRSLQLLSGNTISLVWVYLGALMKADLKRWIRDTDHVWRVQCPFKRLTLGTEPPCSYFYDQIKYQQELQILDKRPLSKTFLISIHVQDGMINTTMKVTLASPLYSRGGSPQTSQPLHSQMKVCGRKSRTLVEESLTDALCSIKKSESV